MEKIKFKSVTYLKGYGSWNIEALEGSVEQSENFYILRVLKGKHSGVHGATIENKSFKVPIDSTVIEENI